MSDNDETIEHETNNDLRVRLVHDECPSEPYDDGGSPIIQLNPHGYYGDWKAEQVTGITSHRVDSRIEEAAAKWGGEGDIFERYLGAFHGTTSVHWYCPSDGEFAYVTFDTAAWREEMGLPVDKADLPAYEAMVYDKHGVDLSLASMEEWRAYCEGDTYGFVVEKRVTWAPINVEADSDVTMETWEEVDSCWGFYGDKYATEAAVEALNDAAGDDGTVTA